IAGVLSTDPNVQLGGEIGEPADERVPRSRDDVQAGPVDPRAATARADEAQADSHHPPAGGNLAPTREAVEKDKPADDAMAAQHEKPSEAHSAERDKTE